MNSRIVLLPLSKSVSLEAAMAASPVNPVVVADCYVEHVESWTPRPWGWQTDSGGRVILNVDHHAEDERFFRLVSSGNLAIQYVETEGVLPATAPVLINHTDCDSILSAAILTGLLPPDEAYGIAVIAADHTGEPNPIADLLQALDPLRDVELSLRNLHYLLRNEPMETQAVELLKKRLNDRCRVKELVQSGAFQMLGSVAVAKLTRDDKVAGELLPNVLPDAAVIISASPLDNGGLETKVRLGMAAGSGETLHSLGVQQWERNFRGRWNAGSTKRSGGSTIDPISLARHLAETLMKQRG
jgi:hypothetical protein